VRIRSSMTAVLTRWFVRVPLGFVFVAGYSEERAVTFAKLAGAAYCHTDVLESWSCGYKCIDNVTSVRTCQGTATHAYIGLWEDSCVLGFQGSGPEYLLSFARDLQSATMVPTDLCEDCHVGRGFLAEWGSLRECVMSSMQDLGCHAGARVRSTGHSLGAAVHAVAMVDLTVSGWEIVEAYDFGKPRVGDTHFAQVFDHLFENKSWRVTRMQDPVPQLPYDTFGPVDFGFEHSEPEIYYAGAVANGFETCLVPHDHTRCVEQYWHVTLDLLHIPDHLHYMGVETGHHGCDNGAVVI